MIIRGYGVRWRRYQQSERETIVTRALKLLRVSKSFCASLPPPPPPPPPTRPSLVPRPTLAADGLHHHFSRVAVVDYSCWTHNCVWHPYRLDSRTCTLYIDINLPELFFRLETSCIGTAESVNLDRKILLRRQKKNFLFAILKKFY